MQLARRLGLSFFAVVLGASLFGLAWSHSLSSVIHDKEVVKSWLVDSDFYSELSKTVADQVAENGNENIAAVANNEEVQQVVYDAIGKDLLQSSVEDLVDGVYHWLDNGVTPPSFTVDISESSSRIAEGIGNIASQRAASLPTCTPAQARILAANYDIFVAPCLPPELTAEQAGAEVTKQVNNVLQSNENTQFESSEFIDGGDQGDPLPKEFREAYQRSKWMPIVFGLLSLVSLVAIFFLSSTRRKGVQRSGLIMASSGFAVGLSALFIGRGPGFVKNLIENNDKNQPGVSLAVRVMEVAGQDVARLLWWYAAIFLIVGLAGVLLAKFYNQPKDPEKDKPTPDGEQEKAAPESEDKAKSESDS